MVMFQVLMMWMSLIRYCQDSKLFMSTNIVCHIVCSLWRFPSSLRMMKTGSTLVHCVNMDLTDPQPPGASLSSPSNTVHSILIGGRNQEADGWYRCLVAFIIQHLPLVRLRVVQQSTFIPSVNCDLEEEKIGCSCLIGQWTEPYTAYYCN